MDEYLIPANSKRSQLIFSIFRPIDLAILICGAFITLVLMLVFKGDTINELIFKLTPIAITGALIMPIPYYHNGLVFIQEMYQFYTRQSRYLWRGWCSWYVGNDEQTKG